MPLLIVFVGNLFGQKSDTVKISTDNSIYIVKQFNAEPIGGVEPFDRWNTENFKKELKTPDGQELRKIYIQFFVNEEGTLTDIALLKGLGEPYDAEALRVVKENPTKWRPSRQNGQPKKQRFNIAVKF